VLGVAERIINGFGRIVILWIVAGEVVNILLWVGSLFINGELIAAKFGFGTLTFLRAVLCVLCICGEGISG